MTLPTKPKKKYIRARAKGESLRESARVAGIAPSTAHKWEQSEDIKQAIEAEAKRYISVLPDSIDLSHKIIRAANSLEQYTSENYKLVELGIKEGEKVRQAVGIAPMQTPSQIIVGALNIDARQVHISGTVGELLRKHFDMGQQGETIDITHETAD